MNYYTYYYIAELPEHYDKDEHWKKMGKFSTVNNFILECLNY